MQARRFVRNLVSVAAALAAPSGLASVRADAISDFYRGKTVSIHIGYPPGGAYDLYARTIARHLGAHIPGNPAVVAQNMPGAASLQATNHVANIAAQDGLTMAAVGAALPFAPMLEPQGARFAAEKINWMASPASFSAITLVWHTSPVKTFDDLKINETLMGSLTPSSTPSFYAAILNDVLKTKIKIVHGYDSMNASMLAMQRGETQGYSTAPHDTLPRSYQHLISAGQIRYLLQLGGAPHPAFKDVPYVLDQAKTPEEREILDLSLVSLKIGYPYLMGPAVPKERVEAVRKAMEETFRDPAFLADAEKSQLDMNPVPGARVQEIVTRAYGAPRPIIERLQAIYQGLVR